MVAPAALLSPILISANTADAAGNLAACQATQRSGEKPLKEPVLQMGACFLLDLDPNPGRSRTELLVSACFFSGQPGSG